MGTCADGAKRLLCAAHGGRCLTERRKGTLRSLYDAGDVERCCLERRRVLAKCGRIIRKPGHYFGKTIRGTHVDCIEVGLRCVYRGLYGGNAL